MILRILLLLLLLLPASARAETLDYKSFGQIPVQHEGRIKPLDSLARTYLKAFSGNENNADQWLAESLFDPAQAMQRPVFRILRPDLLNLPPRAKKYYSYAELAPALRTKNAALQSLMKTDEKNWTEDQKELAQLKALSLLYEQLLRSFSFLLPLNIEPPASLTKEWKISPERVFTLQDYTRYERRLKERLQQIIRKKGEDPEKYTDEEKQIAMFAFNMQILRSAGENNILLRVIPGQDSTNGEWFSPWALRESGEGSPQTAAYMKSWQALAHAYLMQDADGWKGAVMDALEQSAAFAPVSKIKMELVYNKWHPLTAAMLLYLAAFAGLILYRMHSPKWRAPAMFALVLGAISHLAAITLRILILSRPPVGTLYESILFVALICVLVALVMEHFKKDGSGLLTGTLSGLLLLFIAESFAEGDTLTMLVAVLNTNFWLATHVLCITIGYGFCLIVSLTAHMWLTRAALRQQTENLSAVKTLAVIALLFTAVGTILGGIWADQSWGRFWGWDPKENGALLIVLWLIWILHGQISGHLNRPLFMAGMAALSIIVALAWFGVNLLSVGLHSYGFITGVAAALFAFCAAELSLIGFLVWRILQKQKAAA